MKTALIYMSRHGSTEKIVKHIADTLPGNIQIFNLAQEPAPELEEYTGVIIGGSIHYGSIQKEVQLFCKINRRELLKKRLGLFVCCLLSTRESDQFERAYPLVLRAHCSSSAVFEGDLVYSKLNLLERIIFSPEKKERDIISINEGAVETFVSTFSSESPRPLLHILH